MTDFKYFLKGLFRLMLVLVALIIAIPVLIYGFLVELGERKL